MLTVIIPTHERHFILKRTIAYWQEKPIKVVILDSSAVAYSFTSLPNNISYRHLPGMRFAEKILSGIELIEHPNIALCPDDDFLNSDLLLSSDSLMQKRSDIAISFGKFFRFTSDNYQQFEYAGRPIPWPKLKGDLDIDVKKFATRYTQVLWSLYRKDVLKNAFHAIELANFDNDNFIELTISLTALASGQLNMVDDVWGIRQADIDGNWGERHVRIQDVNHGDFKKLKVVLKDYVSENIISLFQRYYISRVGPYGVLERYKRRYGYGVVKRHDAIVKGHPFCKDVTQFLEYFTE
ncbi:TIGR00180 family glycosyltransferase [Catenovulum sp. SM1970]|uniref:TIGR00180 family glycosyltransferase n=1 Tax=Marinifaba aquimaris TaxID=2741323 RepID=UPI0015722D27|nr:TIGR00180 family glycosyltransferase [Marinifaba aquimaris]NTS75349.1 TIGR00180 family glycosyltransferase [Marinifaba aquimaris]